MKPLLITVILLLTVSALRAADSVVYISPSPPVLLQQPAEDLLLTRLEALEQELREHRARENFFSDLISTNNMLWGALLAFIGVLIGGSLAFLSWNKYKTAKEELQKVFDLQMEKHKQEEAKFISQVNWDRINLRRQTSNFSYDQGDQYK